MPVSPVRAVLALLLLVASPATADKLSIERAFAQPSLVGNDAVGAQLSPDGRLLGWLSTPADDATATLLWVRPVAGGAPRLLVDSRKLGRATSGESDARMKAIERRYGQGGGPLGYRWSPDAQSLVVNFAADLFLVQVADGRVQRLTQDDADEFDAKVSPGGRFVSFVRGRDLLVQPVAGGAAWRAGADASDTIAYGQAEFVAQEEMRRFTGQWWSPDGGRIAYTRVDESPVRVVPRVRIEADSVAIVNDRYPLTGTPNARVQLFIRGADGTGAPVAVDLGRDPDFYLAHVDWSRDGRTLYALRESRDQKRLDLLAVDPTKGRSRVLVSEVRPTWVDLENDFRPLADGGFLWGSTRTGWRHLYLYDRNGKLVRAVTHGSWRVANIGVVAAEDYSAITGVDEARGLVYFIASRTTPIERDLYVTSFRHADEPRRITGGGGWWTPFMAGDAPSAFLGQYSDPATPPNTGLYGLDGKRMTWVAENRLDARHPLFRYLDNQPRYEFGTIRAANGADLHYSLARPPGFDPTRRYPVIVRPYGGPNVQIVTRQWHGPTDQLLTQEGYLVFALDNRGGINRDEAFEHAVAGNLGGVNMDDQLAGIRFLRGLPYVDPDRIGMTGWSFGGYTTLRMLTEPDSGVRAGAAGGVPSRFELYDTHYTERFIGTPQDAPAAYRRSDLLPRVANLHGSLMLLHGLTDDNVVVANFTALTDALQKEGKTFETVVYPGMAHVPRGQARQVHMWRTFLDFFARRMPPAAKATATATAAPPR